MKKNIVYALTGLLLANSCKNSIDSSSNQLAISPEAGTAYPQGKAVQVKVSNPAGLKVDSVVYLIDSVRVTAGRDLAAATLKTDSLKLGPRVITARLYAGGKPQEVSTNITLLAAKAPEKYTYQVEKVFPHDTSSFTEGLEYHDGVLYESAGGYANKGEGRSSLRKADLTTGKVLQKADIDSAVFAEGITLIAGKLIQLTYHEKVGYIYDPKTLKRESTFPFNAAEQGWGLCNDGRQLYATIGEGESGTNQILILDKNTLRKTGDINVYDDQGPVSNLNELELVDGLFYANIWQKDIIVVIDPKTGAVIRSVNLEKLYPQKQREKDGADVLNGIAWDAQGRRLFITGKNWPKLYQVKFVKKAEH